MITAHALHELAEVSARIGGEPALVQGPGGNSSIKDDEILWVKGSGVWLSEALEKPIFVPITRASLGGVDQGFEVPADAVIAELNPAGLRPSIETALHSMMPHRVVLHAHAVNTMAVSVLVEGRALAAARLDGLDWAWIDYRRPGAPLAIAIDAAMATQSPDVLLLQNHGIVVGAADTVGAEALLRDVEDRLRLTPRAAIGTASQDILALETGLFEVHAAASAAALDPTSLAVLTQAPLIPDQVVFLGGAVPLTDADDDVDAVARAIEARTGAFPALVLVAGVGALAARSRSAAADALIGALLAIAERVPSDAAIRGLGDADVAALLDWDAEHYRRALDAQRAKG